MIHSYVGTHDFPERASITNQRIYFLLLSRKRDIICDFDQPNNDFNQRTASFPPNILHTSTVTSQLPNKKLGYYTPPTFLSCRFSSLSCMMWWIFCFLF